MPALPGRPAGEASGPASRGLISAATWSPMAAGGSASCMEPSELRLLKGMTSVGQGAWCSRCDDRLACPSCTYTKPLQYLPSTLCWQNQGWPDHPISARDAPTLAKKILEGTP